MKKWFTFIMTILLMGNLLIGCSSESTNPPMNEQETNMSEVNEDVVFITISKDEESEILSEKEVEIEEGDFLMDVMKHHFDIEEGGFIHSIDGVAPAEGEEKSWMFFVNGEMAMVGAAEYELSVGDQVLFDLQAWE